MKPSTVEPDETQRVRSVLIIEDHALTQQGIAMVVSALPGFEVDAIVGDAQSLRALLAERHLDIAILDLELPGAGGLSLLGELLGRDMRVIVLSGTSRARDFAVAIGMGAHAVVSKSDPPDMLRDALAHVVAEPGFRSTSVAKALGKLDTPGADLSPRQTAILALLNDGESNKEIAYRLGIAPPTVAFHLSEMRTKLGVGSTRQIIDKAREMGLL